MSDARLPPTGSVEVVQPDQAAEIVEEIADDVDGPGIPAHRLLIALDIDGTVLLEDESLSPGIVDAVEHAQSSGHEIMLATGRSWEGTRGVLEALGIAPEYVVCSNGAVVLKRLDAAEPVYERFHVETFDPRVVLDTLRDRLPDAHFMVELPDGRRMFTEHLDDWNLQHATQVAFDELIAQRVCRIVVVDTGKKEDDFVAMVAELGLNQVTYAVGWTAWLDVAPFGVDKGTALEMVRDWLEFDPAQVLVMGDGRNDLGMFEWARRRGGRAIAMAQGPQEVRDAAGETTSSVHEGGVAAVLRAL